MVGVHLCCCRDLEEVVERRGVGMGAAEDGRVGGDGPLSEAAVRGPPGHGGDGIRPEAIVDCRSGVRGPGGIEQVGKRSDL